MGNLDGGTKMSKLKNCLEQGEKEQAKALIPNVGLEELNEALLWAIGKKDHEMVELFCQSLSKTEWLGRALKYAATKFGDAESVRLLINAGANVNYTEGFGTPLTEAAKAGNVETIQLLAEAGANLNFQDPDNKNTPLHEAVNTKKIAAVKKLVELGAAIKIKNRDGQTPIDLTRMNFELRKFLEEAAQNQQDIVPAQSNTEDVWEKIETQLRKHPLDYLGLNIEPLTEEGILKLKPYQSKLGGNPYLPDGYEIPKDSKGNQMSFLAQINFAEMPKLEGYPQSGLAQFYISLRVDALHDEAKALYFNDTEDITEKMQEISEPKRLIRNIYSIDFCGPFESYPYPNDRLFYQITKKYQPFDDELEEIISDHQQENSEHRIGGYAFLCQEDPRGREEYRDYIQLLQIDQLEDEAPFTLWGDNGAGHFFIHPDDLKKCDFSKAFFYCDSY